MERSTDDHYMLYMTRLSCSLEAESLLFKNKDKKSSMDFYRIITERLLYCIVYSDYPKLVDYKITVANLR